MEIMQKRNSRKGVCLVKGGYPLGTIRDGWKKVADTGGKGDWIKLEHHHANLSNEKLDFIEKKIKEAYNQYGYDSIRTQDKIKNNPILDSIKKELPDFDYRELKIEKWELEPGFTRKIRSQIYYAKNYIGSIVKDNPNYTPEKEKNKVIPNPEVGHDGKIYFKGNIFDGSGADSAVFNLNENFVIKFPTFRRDSSKGANYSLRGKYSKDEKETFKLMEKHPEIFPKTKLVEEKDRDYVLQEKVDVENFKEDYGDLWDELLRRNIVAEHILDLYESPKLYTITKTWRDHGAKLSSKLEMFVFKLHDVLQQFKKVNPNKYPHDLRYDQFGYDNKGDIKLVDFGLYNDE